MANEYTYYCGVDLAPRYSAAVLLNSEGKVEAEALSDFGPAAKPSNPYDHFDAVDGFVKQIIRMPSSTVMLPKIHFLVEDVYPHAVNAKGVLRYQGIILHAFWQIGIEPDLILPLAWQRAMGYVRQKGRSTKVWAREKCTELGYDAQFKGKAGIDLRDAYLIAEYDRRQHVDSE